MVHRFFFDFRSGVYGDFSGLFNGTRETTEQEEEDYEDEDNPTSYEEKKKEQFQRTWGWYDMIARLAEGDLLKQQQYYKLPIKSVLNHLSYQMSGGVRPK